MMYLLGVVGFVLGLVVVVQVGGMMLPVAHVARAERWLPASPDRVWRALTEVERYPLWRAELSEVNLSSKEPLAWTERSKFGELPMKSELVEPSKRWVVRIGEKGRPFGGTWTYELAPEGEGTRLAITENGEVYPPAFRFLSKYVFGHTKSMTAYLAALETHLKMEDP